jgi:hypothetical protein|tara:strand:- start:1 stop:111 length:111 start_codon:yes stop_codon:yes gene_type:complete
MMYGKKTVTKKKGYGGKAAPKKTTKKMVVKTKRGKR